MSKLCAIAILLFSLSALAETGKFKVQIQRDGVNYIARKNDKNGFVREYRIKNIGDFKYHCLRYEGRIVNISGKFDDIGSRSGVVDINAFGEEVDNPLSL